jgi:hypothetical protein
MGQPRQQAIECLNVRRLVGVFGSVAEEEVAVVLLFRFGSFRKRC